MRVFTTPPVESITFGAGALDALPAVLDDLGAARPLVVMSGSLARGEIGARLRTLLGDRSAAVVDDVPQHVPRSAVVAAARTARTQGADSVVSLGGGTSIDCAKAVALCLSAGIDDAEELDGYRARREADGTTTLPRDLTTAVPHVAVPTTLSGAELTDIIGITDDATRAKHIYRFRALAPRSVVLDPEVAAQTPPWLWAASGVRALDHAVESMLATGSMPFVDALAARAIRLLDENLPRSVADPGDLDARSACLQAAWLAIYGITNTGAGLSHAVGHQLATRFDLLHGVSSAIMLPRVMAFNAAATRPGLAQVAAAFGRPDDGAESIAPGLVAELIARLPVPTRISEAGGSRAPFAEMAAEIAGDISMAGNARQVTESDIVGLLESAW